MVALERDEKGRLKRRYSKDVDELLDLVARAARRLPSRQRPTMTQEQFDRAREERRLECPVAKRVAEIVRLPWSEVVWLAQQPVATRTKRLGMRDWAERREWTEAEIADAIRLIADRLRVETVTMLQYRVGREAVLREAARARRHKPELDLPDDHQILNVVKGWGVALRLAGLERPSELKRLRGWPLANAINWFVDEQGRRPLFTELDNYGKLYDVAIERRKHLAQGKTFDDVYREVMADRGEEPEDAKHFSADRETGWRPGSRPPEAPHRKRKDWTREECVAAVAEFLSSPLRDPGEHPTVKDYNEWLDRGGDGPVYSTLRDHARNKRGAWEEMLAAARRQLAAKSKRKTRRRKSRA